MKPELILVGSAADVVLGGDFGNEDLPTGHPTEPQHALLGLDD